MASEYTRLTLTSKSSRIELGVQTRSAGFLILHQKLCIGCLIQSDKVGGGLNSAKRSTLSTSKLGE
jgi:hypothetical protein